MKTLKQFILEEYNDYRVKNLEVPYIVNPKTDYIVFETPEIWSEDDFQIYLQDKYLNDMPGGEDYAEDFFGKNSNNILDVLFNYDTYEKSEKINEKDFVKFDKEYDTKVNDDTKFVFVKLKKLRYVIQFDEFDLKDESIENINQTLIEIFKQCDSSIKNEWPLEIVLDEDNIKYE